MRYFMFGMLVLLAGAVSLAAQPGSAPPADAKDEPLEKKLKDLRDQIEELRQKQSALEKEQEQLLAKKNEKERQAQQEAQRKEVERRQKEAAERKASEELEKKKHFAKVEIRGKLVKVGPGSFQVAINELTWTLNFGANKNELAAQAEKLADKGVIVTGRVSTKKAANPYGIPGGMPWPQPPNPWGWPQQPNWGGLQPPAWPYYVPMEQPVIITVESLKVAND